jgi:hypothetical protein
MTTPPLPEQIELHRDRMWRRDEDLRIESAVDAERFIADVGFANTLTDARRAGPSLYIAVCGRRDVKFAPQHSKKEAEERRDASHLAPQAGDHAPWSRLRRLLGETRGRSFDVCRAGSDKPFCRHLDATAERRATGLSDAA